MLSSVMAAPLCIPTQSLGGFHFPYIFCSAYFLEIFLTSGRGFFSVDLISIDLIVSLPWCDSAVKNLPAMQEMGERQIQPPELGRSPREENGNTLQYSFPENPMDRGD